MSFCQADGCIRPYYAKGLCGMHYTRFKRHGDHTITKFREKCIIENCTHKHFAKGFCKKHYEEKYKNRRNELLRIRRSKNPQKSRGDCKKYRIKNRPKILKREKQYRSDHKKILREKHILWTKKFALKMNMKVKTLTWALWNWNHSVKDRDNENCQICGSFDNLHSHHIFEKSKYPQLCLNLNNGITLCHDHHWELHRLN